MAALPTDRLIHVDLETIAPWFVNPSKELKCVAKKKNKLKNHRYTITKEPILKLSKPLSMITGLQSKY